MPPACRQPAVATIVPDTENDQGDARQLAPADRLAKDPQRDGIGEQHLDQAQRADMRCRFERQRRDVGQSRPRRRRRRRTATAARRGSRPGGRTDCGRDSQCRAASVWSNWPRTVSRQRQGKANRRRAPGWRRDSRRSRSRRRCPKRGRTAAGSAQSGRAVASARREQHDARTSRATMAAKVTSEARSPRKTIENRATWMTSLLE